MANGFCAATLLCYGQKPHLTPFPRLTYSSVHHIGRSLCCSAIHGSNQRINATSCKEDYQIEGPDGGSIVISLQLLDAQDKF